MNDDALKRIEDKLDKLLGLVSKVEEEVEEVEKEEHSHLQGSFGTVDTGAKKK